MNRDRYKYRVWDKERKEYFGEDYEWKTPYMFDEIYGAIFLYQASALYKISEDKTFVIEQCTGLADIDKKLIYEGDYVEHLDCIYVIYWNDYDCSFYGRDFKDPDLPHLCLQQGQKLKIIGNRFEGIGKDAQKNQTN